MLQRLTFLLRTWLWTMVVFIMAKIGFMFYNHNDYTFTYGDIVDVVVNGLRLDLSSSLYVLLPPFLLLLVGIWIRIPRWPVRIWFVLTSVALALAFVADSSLYPFWGIKLNVSCLQYLDTPHEAFASVSITYLVLRVLAIVMISIVIWRGYPQQWPQIEKNSKKVFETVIGLLMIPFFLIGIRGGIGEATTNVGQVYYSQNLFLNHSAVNPVFSFFSSFEHGEKDYYHYNYFDDATCQQLLEGVFNTESIDCDTLLTTRRPNIIVILLESCGAVFTALGGNNDVMPHLNAIAEEGISFTRCYANSWRTDRGTVCTLSGWASFPNVSVMKMPEKSQTMPSLAHTMAKEGYSTCYLYGGDINFTNMRSYLVATGWQQLISMENYTRQEQKTSKWGVRDDITFATLFKLATTTKSHYLIGYSTLSSHEPWEVPLKKFDDEVLNAFSYLDKCIGDFVDSLKTTKAWDNLLIVMLPDHGIKYKDLDEANPLRNQIPVIWTGGVIKAPRRINTICNQSDLAATLLGQLALNHDDFTFSRDVMSQTYNYPFAVHNYNNAQLMIDSTGFILYDFDAEQFLVEQSKDAQRMLKVNKAILQKTTNDLKNR